MTDTGKNKRGLGRGFDALIPTQLIDEEFDVTAKKDDEGKRVSADQVLQVEPDRIKPNPHQPRQYFDEAELQDLAESIKVHGVLQPLIVTAAGDGHYELIAGERRLRASKLAGLTTVPVIIRSYDEQQKLELAIIENIQRADLNPIETATAYRKLVDQFNLKGDDLGRRVGKDRSTVSNTMRLLNLPLEAKRAVAGGKISEGHARVILSIPELDKQLEMLDLMIKNGWTVRQSEEFARGFKGNAGTKEKAMERISSTNTLTTSLSDYLGAKVTMRSTAKGGKLIIEYYSDEELDRIYRAIHRED